MAITKRQREILDWISRFVEENRYSPSYTEIAEGVGLKSVSTVSDHLHNLADRGFITIDFNRGRSITLVGK